jgi:hypothetical protein
MEKITYIHWFLAYAGLFIQILLKLSDVKGNLLANIKRKDVLTVLASIIAIPVVLIVCTDSAMKELLPINYLTALLAGQQTQYLLSVLVNMGRKITTKSE